MRLRFVLCLVLGLVGCQSQPESPSSHYLMTHPSVLKNKAAACEQQSQAGEMPNPDCPMIVKSMDAYFALLLDQQREPEQFGRRILTAQEAYGLALAKVVAAEQALNAKTAAHASEADLKASQQAYQAAMAAADEAKANIDVLLVVVGESSPE